MINIEDFNILNHITKYPSIKTYHKIRNGRLEEQLTDNERFYNSADIYITEKIDGSNFRIIIDDSGDYIIGNRNTFLYAKGDRIKSNEYSVILNNINLYTNFASDMFKYNPPAKFFIIYGELFGGKGNKIYSKTQQTDFRVFDIQRITSLEWNHLSSSLTNINAVINWRESSVNFDRWFSVNQLSYVCNTYNIKQVPSIKVKDNKFMCTSIKDTYKELKNIITTTNASIDNDYAGLRAEGIVVRTGNRSLIRKIRYEDYEKTLKCINKNT